MPSSRLVFDYICPQMVDNGLELVLEREREKVRESGRGAEDGQ